MFKNKLLIALIVFVASALFVFSAAEAVQQIQLIPLLPQEQLSPGQLTHSQRPAIQQQQTLFPLVAPQTQPSTQQTPMLKQLPVEKISEFEQYLAEKPIEINENQFDILQKFEGIIFSNSSQSPYIGTTVIPVKVVRPIEMLQGTAPASMETGAGFLIGTPDIITNAFKMLGIKSTLSIATDIKQSQMGQLYRHPACCL